MFQGVATVEVPEVCGGLGADGDSFVLFIISLKDLLDLRSLQQSHTSSKLCVAMIWMAETTNYINRETTVQVMKVGLSSNH